MDHKGRVYSCPPGAPFIPTLVQWLLGAFNCETREMTMVFVPNQRSLDHLTQALTRHLPPDQQPTIISLGEAHHHRGLSHLVSQHSPLPTTLTEADFQNALAHLWFQDHPCDETQLTILQEFFSLFSQSVKDEVDWSRLDTLTPDNLSAHRQAALGTLDQLLAHTGQIMGSHGLAPESYHRWFLDALAMAWQKTPPTASLIFAGSTGSQPAVRRLMKQLFDQGCAHIVLPGYTPQQGACEEHAPSVAHPDYLMERLVRELGAPVEHLPVPQAYEEQSKVVTQLKMNTFPTGQAQDSQNSLERLPLHVFEAPTSSEEMAMIVHLLREAIEENIPSTVIVLNDGRMMENLQRVFEKEGIRLSSPVQQPLARTPLGHFARQLLAWPLRQWALVPFLCLAKNHVCHEDIRLMEEALSTFENHVLRRFPVPNDVRPFMDTSLEAPLRPLFERFQQAFGSFWTQEGKQMPLGTWAQLHRDACLTLMDRAFEEDAAFEPLTRLWDRCLQLHTLMGLDQYEAYFAYQLKQLLVYKAPGQQQYINTTSTVEIVGPLEARLLTVDRLIIPRMNDSVWPRSQSVSPWLGEHTRQGIGFSPFDQIIGQSAHDFIRCLSAREVYLTRSLYEEGSPTLPSPWLTRLERAYNDQWPKVLGPLKQIAHRQAQHIHDLKIPRAAWVPPQVSRAHKPLKLWATSLERLFKNPYAFYGSHILKLKPLDPFGYALTPARYGQLIHHLMHQLITLTREEQTYVRLEDMATKLMQQAGFSTLQDHRFRQMLVLIFEQHLVDLSQSIRMDGEIQGTHVLTVNTHEISLNAKADRLDTLRDETVAILDYKSGQIPTYKGIHALEDVQLLLEAMILHGGGYLSLGKRICQQIEYRQTKIGASFLATTCIRQPVLDELLADFEQHLEARLRSYLEDDFPFDYVSKPTAYFEPYAHLSRRETFT